jgi:energy-coupling factor transporter ATP-binding protein EcfA2/uncharacterized membrane protein
MNEFFLQNLSFSYPEQERRALDGVNLTVERGEFLVLCGPSGCGKSTLLRQLKPSMTPAGQRTGEIFWEGTPVEQLDFRTQSQRIGFVQQSPDNQLVTDKVWHELAFGLESLGCDTPTIRRRVAEMASFFGIQRWFYWDVAQLSGGQKQLLNLAAVIVMQPSVLILDEPTAQLDPIAASDFLSTLGKLNRELGTTIVLTEHRLEEAFPLAHRVAVLDGGRVLCVGRPKEVGETLKARGHSMFLSMPTPMQVWAAVDSDTLCPVTVGEGRAWLHAFAAGHPLEELPPEPKVPHLEETAVVCREVWFRYEKNLPHVVRGLSLTAKKGEFLALLGGNGTGKTTTLRLLAGLSQPSRGAVTVNGSVGLLPQNPQTLFVKKTVREDLLQLLRERGLSPAEGNRRVEQAAGLCRLEGLLERHPYDLSGGEQQRAALAKVLLTEPEILLLDEPTKGLDAEFKCLLGEILQMLLRQGVTILMVSHDLEFCARYAHQCALFFDGGIVTQGTPRAFFSGNSFYTTAANRMARSLLPEAVTGEDIIAACGGTVPEAVKLPEIHSAPEKTSKGLPEPEQAAPAEPQKQKLSRRTAVAAGLIFLLIPLTLCLGERYLGGRKYYFISLLVLLECMAPFFLIFEGRKPQTRELVVVAVLCAIGVAGRAAFFMVPQFKPVMAIVIVAGVSLGGETGFLVGAMTMLASNVLFSQGPWTPWQMFAMGLVGFLAGVLFGRGGLPRNRVALSIYGALAAILVYGGIMNPASALLWADEINWEILLAYYLSGFPMDCVQAAATAVFLWLAGEPMLEKLERVKGKYWRCP